LRRDVGVAPPRKEREFVERSSWISLCSRSVMERTEACSEPSPSSSRSSGPPPLIVENAMLRGQPKVPLSKIAAVGCGVVVLVIMLALLLFI
jgi:hypothetical protein